MKSEMEKGNVFISVTQTQRSIRIMKKLYVNRLENFGKVSVSGYICSSKISKPEGI